MFCIFSFFSASSFAQTNLLPSSGNVGINTLTPSAGLDVNARMKVDSNAIFKDSVNIKKRLTVDQDIKVLGKSVFVDDGKFKNKLTIKGITKMEGDAKVLGDIKIKSLENTSISTNRLLSIMPNGKVVVAPITLPPDDTYTCNYTMPWAFATNQTLPDTSKIMLCPNFTDVGIGTTAPLAKLHVSGGNVLLNGRVGIGVPNTNSINNTTDPQLFVNVIPAYDRIAAAFTTPQRRGLLIVPKVNNTSFSALSVKNDVGIFWSSDFTGTNGSGLVLAPKTPTGTIPNLPIGMRINESGRFGFNTAINNQVQYTMKSNSLVGLLVNTTTTPGAIYGIRTIANNYDVAFSVISPTATLTDPSTFSVKGNGEVNVNNSVNMRTDPNSSVKSLTVKDINNNDDNTNDLFRVMSNGNVFATRVQVMDATDFPDYVFTKDYNLITLNDLEVYITNNKHLPNMPTAKQVEKEGMDLGEMNRVLVEKVEELTLHMIAMNKRMEALEAENKRLKK